MKESNNTVNENRINIAVIMNEINSMKDDIKEIRLSQEEGYKDIKASVSKIYTKLDDSYLTKEMFKAWIKSEFTPIKKFIYAIIGAILMAVLFALVDLVLN